MRGDSVSGAPERAPVRVAIVNDYELVVRGLRTMLSDFPDRVRVVEVSSSGTPDREVDVALFDTFASPRSSLTRISEMISDDNVSRVALYTWDLNDEFTARALQQSVHSVISKTVTGAALVDLLEKVNAGERVEFAAATDRGILTELSEREREVAALISAGETNQTIADELFVGLETVKSHVRSILRKLGARNRTEVAALARSVGLVKLVDSESTN